MADEKIVTSIVANSDFSNLIADVQRVTSSLHKLQQEFAGSNRALAAQIDAANAMFNQTMLKTGQFSSHFVSLTSDVEKFGRNLDSGRLKLKDYFRVYQDHVRTSGGLVRDLAKQQVQLQNAVLQPLGRNAQGLMQYNVHIPRGLDLTKNKTALLKQELQIMNKVIQDGGVQLINWGKNTQWAGRQLTVGLTLPLVAFGKAAADAFKVADQELTRLTKVYGDVAGTSAQELAKVRKDVAATAKELSSAMGVNFAETIGLAADIAATGKTGNELLSSVSETTRLAVLGEVDRQEAMKATLAIQSAFKQNTEELAESINFLNAVENQTSTTLNDLVEAIPKAGPVIKGLGGSVQDLALYLTAMREGGINASEGANALKSALASLINPTDKAVEKFQGFGIDLLGIVGKNAGDVTATLMALQSALDRLDPLSKQQAIEQLFGKFQFSRLNALFENLGRQGSQTLQVLDLMNASASQLEAVAGRELAAVTESAAGRYKRAVESLKADLAGVGDQFLDIATKLVNVLNKILDFGQKLPDPIKKILAFGGAFTAIIGPVIMLTGVLANFFGYIIKGLGHFKALFKGAEGFKLLTPEIIAAKNASSMLSDEFYSDAKAADTLRLAIDKLSQDLIGLQVNATNATKATSGLGQVMATSAGTPIMPMGSLGGPRIAIPEHPLIGGYSRAAAHLNPRNPNDPSSIFGLTLQPIPLNRRIGRTPQILMNDRLPDVEGLTSVGGISTGVVAGEHARYAALMATLGVQSKQEIEELKKIIGLGGQVSKELIDTFDDILPITQRLTANAAVESAAIVADLKAGKLTVEQAKAAIIATNAELERMMGIEITQYAALRGRTIDLTKSPLIDQPVVDLAGKPNTRGMFRQGIFRDVMDALGRATKTKTLGGPYSIETTRPIQRNMGGAIFYNNGDQVPGPNVNADVVPAMLTPGEFVIRRDVAQQDPEGMRLLNEGQAVVVPTVNRNRGGAIPGIQYLNTAGSVLSRAMRSAGTAQTKTRATLAEAYGARVGMSPVESRFYFNPERNAQEDRAHAFFPVVDLAKRKAAALRGYFGIASVNKYNKLQNRLFKKFGIKDVNPLTDATATTETLPAIFRQGGAGKWFDDNAFIGDGVVDTGKLLAYLDNLEQYFMTKKWNSKAFGPLPLGFISTNDKSSSVRFNELREYIEYLASGNVTRVNKHGIILNDAAALMEAKGYSASEAISEAESIYLRAMREGDDDWSYYARRMDITENEYPFMMQLKNRGGRISRFNNGGRVPGYFGGKGVKGLASSVIKRITAKWGKVYGGDSLSNADPLHGPLQIGKYTPPLHIRHRRQGASITYKGNYHPYTWDKGPRAGETVMIPGSSSRVGAFLTGSMEERGRYVTEEYMRGNYEVLRIPGAIEAMKAWGKKASGTFHRGITLKGWSKVGGQMKPLPDWLLAEIEAAKASGDFSKLIGKEFIMRRSSWSSNPETAAGFGDFQLIADVKNRRVTPASQMFPDLDFLSPGSTVKVNESESIFGGKFRITGANANGLQIETVSGPLAGNRAFGGPVNAGMPYIVGENGPEVFVPKNAGGIIPGYNKGGYAKGIQNRNAGGAILKLLAALGIGFGGQKVGERVGGGPGQAISMLSSILPFMMMPGMGGMSGLGVRPTVQQRLGVTSAPTLNPNFKFGSFISPENPMMIQSAIQQIPKRQQSIFAQGTPFLGKFSGQVEKAAASNNLFAKTLGRVGLGLTRTNVALGVVAAGVYLGYKAWKNYQETLERTRLAAGLNEESAQKLGLKYKSLRTELKASIETFKVWMATNKAVYEGMMSADAPFKMTISEYKKLRKEVKETMKDQIDLINNTKDADLGQLAVQMKAMFVAAGMSADEAAKKVYMAFTLSNKAAQAGVSTIGNKAFNDIKDSATAATAAIDTFNLTLKKTKDGEAQLNALNTAWMAISASIDEATKKAEKDAAKNKENFDETQARLEEEKRTLDELSKIKIEPIGDKLLNQLAAADPAILKFATALDTVVSLMQKMTLLRDFGFAGDLSQYDAQGTADLYAQAFAINQKVIAASKTGSLKGEYAELAALEKRRDELEKAARGEKVQTQINRRDRIKGLEDEIKKINEAADARRKALQEEADDQDINIEIQKKRLEYQQKLASGDMGGAAQSQLDLQQLINRQQRTLTERQIEDKRAEDVKPLQDQIDKLNKKSSDMADKAALAAESLDGLNKKISDQQSKIDAFNKSVTAYLLNQENNAGNLDILGAAAIDAAKALGLTKDEIDKWLNARSTGGTPPGTAPHDLGMTPGRTRDPQGFKITPTGVDLGPNKGPVAANVIQQPDQKTVAEYNRARRRGANPVDGTPYAQLVFNKNTKKWEIIRGYDNVKALDPKQVVTYDQWNSGTKRYAAGGHIRGFFGGTTDGPVEGPGSWTSDSILARLSNGEFVTKSSSVNDAGVDNMHLINQKGSVGIVEAALNIINRKNGGIAKYKDGGRIDKGTAQSMVGIASKWLGYKEKFGNDTIFGSFAQKVYGLTSRFIAWCGAFINWVANKAGVPLPSVVSTSSGAQSFMAQKRWTKNNPKPGDLAFMNFAHPGRIADHVGLVYKNIGKNSVGTIEGNTSLTNQRSGGGVARKVRLYGPGNAIVGFGRPKYKDGAPVEDLPATTSSTKTLNGKPHTVSKGESLSAISSKYGVSVAEILKANPELSQNSKYLGGSRIFSGTKINVPKFHKGGAVGHTHSGGMPSFNPFGMGMEWFGNTLSNAAINVSKFALGFDPTKSFGKQSGLEKLSMAAILIPGSGLGKSGVKAISHLTPEMKSFNMADIDAKAMQALSKMDLSSIKIPETGISFNPSSAKAGLEALKEGSTSSSVWEIIQAQRETLLKNKYPKVDLSDVTKFNEYYAKEFYGLLPDEAIKLFKGVRSTTGSAWRTGQKDLGTYFSTNPHVAALYSAMIGKAKIGEELPMFGIDKKISELKNFLGEGAIRSGNAQGSMEFPQILGGGDLSKLLPSIYSLPGQVYGQMFGAAATSLKNIKNVWPSGFAGGGYINPSFNPKMNLPSFDSGVNNVYTDMLAQVHKNEAVIPAEFNPWNPTASNPLGGEVTINNNLTIHASPDMNTDELTNRVFAKVEAATSLALAKSGRNRAL
jgi:TP901 family phage tail tape measure protein